ncbi:hypothetical protein CH339_20155 [Rhodobium orientis]|uniref:Methyltransferase domain-containing protein n=1 Tax=Rhodobium orientis TaxID=34017 RepID=A0A327JFU6_9HYPH|nr:hypothetical protein [Rhodobium orientis]RAI25005.1 hypothetical protein CH339_20155 [Rhodobium orientis]
MTRADWNRRYEAKELIWSASANGTLVSEISGLACGRALDLAGGEGRNAVWLAEKGWQVHVVDFADEAIEKGKRLAAKRGVTDRITFETADLTDYRPAPEAFDLVIMMYFHIPVADLPPIFKRAAQALVPSGTFLLVGHDADNLAHGYGGPQRADLLYNADFVTSATGDILDVEKAGRIERKVDTDEGVRIAYDCLVRGRRR